MHFAQPYWLLLILLVPVLVTTAVVVARLRGKQWAPFVAGRLRHRLVIGSSPVPRWLSMTLAVLGLVLLSITLARPQADAGVRVESIMGRNILIALDLSRSMKTPDLKPDRLTQAKALCFELLEDLPNDRIGLVGFAGSSYLFAPLTVDHSAVRQTISELDIDWIPTGGSNLAGGLELSIETLKKTGTRQNALILLTDGEEHIGRIGDLAADAKAAGIQVITIGFGTSNGEYVPDPSMADGFFHDRQGKRVLSRLETGPLERVASVTGGRFAQAASGADIPSMVKTAVKDLDQVELKGRQTTIMVENFQWTLLPAILALIAAVFAGTRWRGLSSTTAVLAGLLIIQSPTARAMTFSEARDALEQEDFGTASRAFGDLADQNPDAENSYSYRLAQGTAAYKEGNWAVARHAFSEALRSGDSRIASAAHHGLANTLFEIGWARLSGGPRYPGLPEKPTDEDDSESPPSGFDKLSDAIIDPPSDDAEGELIGFETMVKENLSEWMAEPAEEGFESNGARKFNELLSDWIDAVNHYGTSDLEDARHNRELTLVYLRKIEEILKQVEDNAQSIQALPMPGSGEPQEGDGEGEPEEGEGEPKGGGDQEDPNESEGDHDDPDSEKDGSGNQEQKESDREGEKDDKQRPDETPEQAAERILGENSDLQKGAISNARRHFRPPEKDW